MVTSTEVCDSPGAELLKVMSPSRILPNHVIAVRRWRRINEKNINEKIKKNFLQRRSEILARREVEFKRNKKIPLDLLAKDWLEKIGGTDELRVYLIENCLPSLVLGLESLLVEVQQGSENDKSFNPINYLAQHLMRNNPRYNHSIDSSSYMKGLNEVKEELRQLVATLRQSKAGKITSEARKRRYERQRKEALIPEEIERRVETISKTYKSWSFGDETIPLYKIQRAMRSFMEEKVPAFNCEMKEVCKYLLHITPEDRKDPITKEGYTRFISEHIEGWPIGAFQALLDHIESCARAVPIGDQKQKIQSCLTSLFRTIDKEKAKSLDRAHILILIKEFYQHVPVNMKKYITNPLDWSDKDTIYSPTPNPSVMTTTYGSTTRSVSITLPKTTPLPPVETTVTDEDADSEGITTPTTQKTPSSQLIPESPSPQNGKKSSLSSRKSSQNISLKKKSSVSFKSSSPSLRETPSPNSTNSNTITTKESSKLGRSQKEKPAGDGVDPDLKHDIEILASEHPSTLSQARQPEIDPRIDISQFLYVTEKLLGEDPHPRALTALSEFLEDSFQETPQQRQSRQLDEKLANKKHMMMIKINDLFDEWDADQLGFLDKTEILAVLSQWQKTSTKSYNIEMSKQICKSVESVESQNLLREDFLGLCLVFHKVLDSDDYMDRLLDFVNLVVKTQRGDLKRERKRRRWMEVMKLLPRISGSEHALYFRGFFDILEKDFAYHGNGRLINVYVALAESDPDADEDDEDKTMLKYVASTANDHSIVVGRTLYPSQKCISNQVKRSGKAVYINQIRNNNQVHLWAMDRWAVDEDRDGAFLVLPLKSGDDKVLGVVGVDTLLSPAPTQFLPHELTFLQNMVKRLSEGFTYLDTRHKFQRTLISLMEVIPRKEASVKTINCYVVEPVPHVPSGPQDPDKPEEHVLRCILALNEKTGIVEALSARTVIHKSDSAFRSAGAPDPAPAGPDPAAAGPPVTPLPEEPAQEQAPPDNTNSDGKSDYLFTCLEKREEQQMRAYGTDHLAMCVLGPDKEPFVVLDLDTGKEKSAILKPAQIKSIRTLTSKLMDVFNQLVEEVESGERKCKGDFESSLPDELRFALRFERMILEDLKRRMSNMDVGGLSELKSYNEPPPIIATVLQVVLLILDIVSEEELQEWTKIKCYLNSELLKKLAKFDPLNKENKVDIHKVNDRLKDLTSKEVKKGGSIPCYLLYQWVIDVISIIRVGESYLR